MTSNIGASPDFKGPKTIKERKEKGFNRFFPHLNKTKNIK